jgi:hypothetical protein
MRALSACSYLVAPSDAFRISWVKVGDHQVPLKTEIPIGGLSDVSISWHLDGNRVLEESKLNKASKIYLAIDGICEHLGIRETIKSWEVDFEQPTMKFEGTIGQIHNLLINNGLALVFSICVVDPVARSNEPLACDFDGGILLRNEIIVSARGEGVLFPLEPCNFSPDEDPIWQVELDFEPGLSAPASSALHVKLSIGSVLEKGLAADPNSNEWRSAIFTLVHAIQTECLIKVFENEDVLVQLQEATNNFGRLDLTHWARDDKSIGFQLNSWMSRLCAGRPFVEVAAEFKLNPLAVIVEFRKSFLRRSQ